MIHLFKNLDRQIDMIDIEINLYRHRKMSEHVYHTVNSVYLWGVGLREYRKSFNLCPFTLQYFCKFFQQVIISLLIFQTSVLFFNKVKQ